MTNFRDKIKQHLNQFDLDIRPTDNGRFMDQKVTPDVLCFIADCIINHVGSDITTEFTVKDIWTSDYLEKNVPAIFGKPSPSNETAASEYNKFVSQPIKALEHAKILSSEKHGTSYHYTINNYEMLELIAMRERTAFLFLYEYITKVLSDSGFQPHLDRFRNAQDAAHFVELKSRFQSFIRGNTHIDGTTEINRIFPKVINVISAMENLPGTVHGRLSRDVFYYSDLMYNRRNWRDLGKLKSQTRQEAEIMTVTQAQQETYNDYRIARAIKIIKDKYEQSEVQDQWATGQATHVHHIFPKSQFSQLSAFIENLIKLTAEQHLNKAHPSGNTSQVDPDYQCTCLIAKSISIENSLNNGEFHYSKNDFIYVINTGLKTNLPQELSFTEIKTGLTEIYNDL